MLEKILLTFIKKATCICSLSGVAARNMNTYNVEITLREIIFGLTDIIIEGMYCGMVIDKLSDCLKSYPEYDSSKTLSENLWVYAEKNNLTSSWKSLVDDFLNREILPAEDKVHIFKGVQTDVKSCYEMAERWWAEEQKEYKIKAQAETILATIIEERKLPPIVDIMLEKCLRKEMVLPEYVEMTHEVLKKWWVHRHEPQEYKWQGYRLGDCDDLKVSTTSQSMAERIWGIKRCLPCSLALALIQDLRKGINVFEPSKEDLKSSWVMCIAQEYGGNKNYLDSL